MYKHEIPEQEAMCKEYYEVLIVALRHIARRCGYALTVHGSLKCDIDLVAVPWRDSAVNDKYLIDEIRKACDVIIGFAETPTTDPTKKPCGRVSWIIWLTHDHKAPYLDIGVMPVPREPWMPDEEGGSGI